MPFKKNHPRQKLDVTKIILVGIPLLLLFWGLVFVLISSLTGSIRTAEPMAFIIFLLSIPIYGTIVGIYSTRLDLTIKEENPQELQNISLTSRTEDNFNLVCIFVIRKFILAHAVWPDYVTLDGEVIADLNIRQFTRFEVTAGKHSIGFKSIEREWFILPKVKNIADINLELEGGRTYYFSIKNELVKPTLEQISADIGEKLIKKLKYIPSRKPVANGSPQP